MADAKVSEKPAVSSAADTDLYYVVVDPGTVAVGRKITQANLRTSLFPAGTVPYLAGLGAVTSAAETAKLPLSDSTLITLANLRKSLSGPVNIFVPPSGDATGVTDTAAIQAAIDAMQAAATDQSMGTVLLSGYYYTASPLQCGAVNTMSRVTIQGVGSTVISYVGAAYAANFANYVIRMYGGRNGPKPLLSNLRIFCGTKSRGVHIAQPNGTAVIENVHVYGSIESAWDLIGCWWLNVRDCAAIEYFGFGARLMQCNGCTYDSLRFWYGSQSGTKWPSTVDTVCLTYTGGSFVTSDAERSAVFVRDSNALHLTNLNFERCTYAAYPLVYFDASCVANRITAMRLEENVNTLEKIKIVGADYITIDGVCATDGLPLVADYTQCDPTVACECFVRCTGTTRGTILNGLVNMPAATQHLIILDGGTHTGTTCTNCSTAAAYIPSADWIGEANAPTVVEDWPDYSRV